MPDDQVIKLLEEIRDLQKQHLENYKFAIENQQQAIEVQKQSVERQKTAIRMVRWLVGAIVLVVLALFFMLPPFNCAIGRMLHR
jgi:hypothetical protein